MMKALKMIVVPTLIIVLMAAMVIDISIANAAKRPEIIEKSNGFPSGSHCNLIIHGKNTEVFSCDSTAPGGNSIIVPEFTTDDLNGDTEGQVSIQYIQSKKASLIDLLVPDPYTGDFVRFDPSSDGEKRGKGKSKGKDITRLFIYAGWVVDASFDSNGDGVINEDDVGDLNGDGYTNADDVELWLEQQAFLGMAWYFSEQDNTWMHEIADLVITEQGLTNMGTKTLQVRFYPRSTTVFH